MRNTYKRDLIGGGEIFGSLFSKKKKKEKNAYFGQYWKLPKFSGYLLMVYPFDPGYSQNCLVPVW